MSQRRQPKKKINKIQEGEEQTEEGEKEKEGRDNQTNEKERIGGHIKKERNERGERCTRI